MSPCQSKLFFNPQFAAIQYVIACVGNSNSSSKHSATVLINKPNSHCGWKREKQSEKGNYGKVRWAKCLWVPNINIRKSNANCLHGKCVLWAVPWKLYFVKYEPPNKPFFFCFCRGWCPYKHNRLKGQEECVQTAVSCLVSFVLRKPLCISQVQHEALSSHHQWTVGFWNHSQISQCMQYFEDLWDLVTGMCSPHMFLNTWKLS